MLPSSIRRLLERQEMMLAMTLCWVVLPVVCTLMGFYLGTFVASQHIQDIQGPDIDRGGIGALIGLGVSVVVALGMTTQFPKVVERDYAAREARHAEASHH